MIEIEMFVGSLALISVLICYPVSAGKLIIQLYTHTHTCIIISIKSDIANKKTYTAHRKCELIDRLYYNQN